MRDCWHNNRVQRTALRAAVEPTKSQGREDARLFWDLCFCVSPLANEFVIVHLLFIPRNEPFKRIFLLLIAPE